jgi:8-oxo-dGTP diphosphatase
MPGEESVPATHGDSSDRMARTIGGRSAHSIPGETARSPVGHYAGMAISADSSSARAQVVAALLRDGNRVLLCHRSASRRWYPNVWDLPGGHVEDGESPRTALVRELREELGITVPQPAGPPMWGVRTDAADMQIWLVDAWAGVPTNAAPDEHDAIRWFEESELALLQLAHDSYLEVFTKVLIGRRC